MANEVWAKLGVDTSSVPADMQKAKAAFSQGGKEIENAAGEHGDNAGSKLVGSLEHRLVGSRHLSAALATALGLNIEGIAEKITSVMVGGSKEAWKQIGEIADENAKLIEKRLELSLSPKGLQEKIKSDAAKAAAEAQGAGKDNDAEAFIKKISPTNAFQDNVEKIAGLFGKVRDEAERTKVISDATTKTLESDVRLEERKQAVKEAQKKLDEFREQSAEKGLTDSEKDVKVNEEVNKLLSDIALKNGSDLELIEKRHRLIELENGERDEALAKKDREIEKERELLRLRTSLAEAQRKMSRDQEELANKKADQGKETIGEIANLKPASTGIQFGQSSHIDTFGLSEEQANAKQSAVDIQNMQKQAEALRTSGDVKGANDLFDQIGTKKQGLVDSGFAKSSEGDQFKQLEETIHKDSMDVQKIIQEIADAAKGKLRNE